MSRTTEHARPGMGGFLVAVAATFVMVLVLNIATSQDRSHDAADDVSPAGLAHRPPLEAPPVPTVAAAPDGRELFLREWMAGDPRSHGGDGLGPVFNETSCVGCHNLGGAGGAGPSAKNVQLVALVRLTSEANGFHSRREAVTIVLHRHSTEADYARRWRNVFGSVPGPARERNTPALFGAGLIDAIDEAVIEEAATKRFEKFPDVSGRVARGHDGRLGRFGWKADTATLKDFVLQACAVELGLDVPGHPQPPLPYLTEKKSPGLDMTTAQCDALIEYVRAIPAPSYQEPTHTKHAEAVRDGREAFTTVGCATCHTPDLGEVEGLYSDLLLHDVGLRLADGGSAYGGKAKPDSPSDKSIPKPPDPKKKGNNKGSVVTPARPKPPVVAAAAEWRTPPLWGVRDSTPYLHDGRATTLEMAILMHAGEAADSAAAYQRLTPRQKRNLVAFLKSLVAPDVSPPARLAALPDK